MKENSVSDPRFPRVVFSDDEVRSFYKPWSRALVVKVMEKTFAFGTIKRRLETLWAKSGNILVSDVANAYFLVSLYLGHEESALHILRDCTVVVEVGKQLNGFNVARAEWSLNLRDWISFVLKKLRLQLDSKAAIALLNNGNDTSHQNELEVLQFMDLCQRDWLVEIKHTYREGNHVADFLASIGYGYPFGATLFLFMIANLFTFFIMTV
ncbi:Putative ribonuclease H protein At1g65750 [Linum perenne]